MIDFERFKRLTDPARSVFQMADEEARNNRAADADSVDILRAMIEIDESIAQYALMECGVSIESFDKLDVEGIHGPDRTLETLYEFGLQEVKALGHHYIGTEHLLLAVVTDKNCRGAKFLSAMDNSDVRLLICKTVIEVLGNSWRKWLKLHPDVF